MTFTVQNGEVWDAFLANASLQNIPDGQVDLPGHSPKIIDDWLSDLPNAIKANFYGWFNDFSVTLNTGLSLNVNSGAIVSGTGYTPVSSTSVIVGDNKTSFITITDTLSVAVVDVLPSRCYPLARVTAASGAVTELIDLRMQSAVYLQSLAQVSPFRPGDIKFSMREGAESGWLLADGSYVDPNIYADLFAVIGYKFGQQGNLFRLPLGGRSVVSKADSTTVGDLIGADQVILTPSQLPSHNHTINQISHSHSINDGGHTHGSYNLSHSHGVNQSAHSHGVSDPTHNHGINPTTAIDTFRNGVPASGYGNGVGGGSGGLGGASGEPTANAITGIGIQPVQIPISIQNTPLGLEINRSTANVSVNSASANVTVNNTGGNQPFSVVQASIVLNMYIKT